MGEVTDLSTLAKMKGHMLLQVFIDARELTSVYRIQVVWVTHTLQVLSRANTIVLQ
jgi:hypothetical protein